MAVSMTVPIEGYGGYGGGLGGTVIFSEGMYGGGAPYAPYYGYGGGIPPPVGYGYGGGYPPVIYGAPIVAPVITPGPDVIVAPGVPASVPSALSQGAYEPGRGVDRPTYDCCWCFMCRSIFRCSCCRRQ